LETLEIHAGREIGRQHFHDDATTERAFLGQEHTTHATAAELTFDAIGAGQRGLQPISKIDVQVLNLRSALSLTSSKLATPTEVPRMTRPRPNSPQYPTPAQSCAPRCS